MSNPDICEMFLRLFALIFLIYLNSNILFAQLCTGSLGDAIVNITFGSGSNPGPQLAAATTGYQFLSADCPNDGFYTVRNNTNNCFGNSWHSLGGDHTGNTNGYFMLVNASLQPSAFYVQTVQGLCPTTTYEFAAWIMNVMLPTACNSNGIQPNLTFSIETTGGTVLQTFNSGNIPATSAPTWRQEGFFFTTPANVGEVVLRIVNNATGGCGNDLALDDITFRPCGPQLTTSIFGQASTNVNVCEGKDTSYTFNASISPGFNNPVYQWQARIGTASWSDIPNANSLQLVAPVSANLPAGTYEYRLSVAETGNINSLPCRILSSPFRVVVNPQISAVANSNSPVCSGNNLVLSATGQANFTWTGPNGFTANGPVVTITQTNQLQSGIYTLTAQVASGCIDDTAFAVEIQPNPTLNLVSADTALCLGDTTKFTASGGLTYSWTPSFGLSDTNIPNPTASPDTTTTYKVLISNALGCTDSGTIVLKVYKLPSVDAGPDKTIVEGGEAVLEGLVKGEWSTFFWNSSPDILNPQALQPIVSPRANTNYILSATALNGCGIVSDTVAVSLFDDVYIPTAFSPNGDGLNDRWNIPALAAYPLYELGVYSRYGKLVFSAKGNALPWDGNLNGKPLPVGTYVYKIKLNDQLPLLSGTVNILR
jgi:gliding motility-associated-like protein